MKKFFTVSLVMLVGLVFASPLNDIMVDVVNGFRKKDASTLSVHFNRTLEIDLPGSKGMFSADQAKVIVQQYFDKNNPTNATLSHSGKSDNGNRFAIIDYGSSAGNKKAKIYLTTISGVEKIQEIKID